MLIWITYAKSQLEDGEEMGFVAFGLFGFFLNILKNRSFSGNSVCMSQKPKSMWVAGGKSFLLLNTSWFYLWVNETGSQIWFFFLFFFLFCSHRIASLLLSLVQSHVKYSVGSILHLIVKLMICCLSVNVMFLDIFMFGTLICDRIFFQWWLNLFAMV